MLDILNHATNYNVAFCQHRSLHRLENNVLSIHRFGGHFLYVQPITIDIVNLNVHISVIIVMDFSSNFILFLLTDTSRVQSTVVQPFVVLETLLC